jgi:hypothetical protein
VLVNWFVLVLPDTLSDGEEHFVALMFSKLFSASAARVGGVALFPKLWPHQSAPVVAAAWAVSKRFNVS